MSNIEKAKKQVGERKKEFEAFDKLTPEEKEARRRMGRDPYESPKERARKQARERSRYRRWFNSLKKETRAKLEELGLSPDRDSNAITRRGCNSLIAK